MASAQTGTTPQRPQPTVRVMRLYRPSLGLANTPPLIGEAAMTAPLSNFLLLPDSFGDLFVGETFRAYVALVNTLEDLTLPRASLSIKIQANNSTCDLFDSVAQGGERALEVGESISRVISHLIADIGQHTLRVIVQYEDPAVSTMDKITLKKLYRFNVLAPMFISAAIYESRRGADSLPVQLSVTNATGQPMSVESVEIDPSHASCGVKAAPIAPKLDPDTHLIRRMNPDESAAFGFRVTIDSSVAQQKLEHVVLGRPVVRWENSFGEGGVYVGEEISYSFPRRLIEAACPVRVLKAEAPPVVVIGEEFQVNLTFVATQYVPPRKYQLRVMDGISERSLHSLGRGSHDFPEMQGSTTHEVVTTLCTTSLGDLDCGVFFLSDRLSGAKYNLRMSCVTYAVASLTQD